MTELDKLTKEKTETEDKIKALESEIKEANSLLWSKKALVKSHQKHLVLVKLTIDSVK